VVPETAREDVGNLPKSFFPPSPIDWEERFRKGGILKVFGKKESGNPTFPKSESGKYQGWFLQLSKHFFQIGFGQ
jgi:hypothetical protein